jgi:hypothetical protein
MTEPNMNERVWFDCTVKSATGERKVVATVSGVKGLAIHLEVLPEEKKGEGIRWQITHSASGLALLGSHQTVESIKDAEKVASLLRHFDWEKETFSLDVLAMMKDEIKGAVDSLRVLNTFNEVAQPTPARYVVRRNEEGSGFNVVDLESDKVMEHFIHRGLASQKATKLNAKPS